jgi:hypothetical protein
MHSNQRRTSALRPVMFVTYLVTALAALGCLLCAGAGGV